MLLSRHALAFALVATFILVGEAKAAGVDDDAEAARAHFSRGTRFYDVGDYHQALDEFKAAHLAKPDAAFLYNIAQCHRQMGEIDQAIVLYKRYLNASPKAPNRSEVEKRIAELESEFAASKKNGVAGTSPQGPLQRPAASATTAAGSGEQGAGKPLPGVTAPTTTGGTPPSAGQELHTVAPQEQGAPVEPPPVGQDLHPTVPKEPDVATQPPSAGEDLHATVLPKQDVTAQSVALVVPKQELPASSPSALRTLRWVGIGVTAALAGGAIIAGVSATTKYNDLKNSCGQQNAGCPSGEVDKVKARALAANVLWGLTGLAAVGTGIVFYLTSRESAVQVSWRF